LADMPLAGMDKQNKVSRQSRESDLFQSPPLPLSRKLERGLKVS
jgi:hypothetical protein